MTTETETSSVSPEDPRSMVIPIIGYKKCADTVTGEVTEYAVVHVPQTPFHKRRVS